jgi:hypothetical protein
MAESHPLVRGILGVALAWGLLVVTGNGPSSPGIGSVPPPLAIGVLVGVILKALEGFIPATRLPNGALYAWTGRSRLRSAAFQGALVGLLVGALSAIAGGPADFTLVVGLTAIGFVIAEIPLLVIDEF